MRDLSRFEAAHKVARTLEFLCLTLTLTLTLRSCRYQLSDHSSDANSQCQNLQVVSPELCDPFLCLDAELFPSLFDLLFLRPDRRSQLRALSNELGLDFFFCFDTASTPERSSMALTVHLELLDFVQPYM